MEEAEPEELPMDQVLGEIRHLLMADIGEKENIPESPMPKVKFSETGKALEKVDYFLLTPAMRCDLPSDSELSETVQKRTQQVLTKLHKENDSDKMSVALTEWLEKNLPQMVDKAVADRLNKN